MSCVLMSPT